MWIHIPITLEKVIKSLGIGNQHPISWEVQEKGGTIGLTMHWTSGSGRHWTTSSAAVPVTTTVSDGDNNSLSSGKSDSEKSTLPSGKARRASVSSLLQTGGASRRPSMSVARLEKIRYGINIYL